MSKEKDDISFSTDNMLTYLKEFNYLEEKYLIKDLSLLKKLEPFERYEQQNNLQKMPPSYIGKTVNCVYGLSHKTKRNTIDSFCYVGEKFINEFLNIKGLELLFNEHYYDFEWDMHLEIDFDKSSPTYYRDHMEHQIRNMYMMMTLLDKFGFMKTTKNILLNNTNSKVSDYVTKRYNSFIVQNNYSDKRKELLWDCAKEYFCNTIINFVTNDKDYKEAFEKDNEVKMAECLKSFIETEGFDHELIAAFFNEFSNGKINRNNKTSSKKRLMTWIVSVDKALLIDNYVRTYSICYIIRSAAIISALFHDISYPICFFLNMRRRVGQYLPAMNVFTNNVEADIDRIVSILQPSLLFTLVSESEIRAKLAKNQKKYDHGVFSSIALLLSYYESGRIHQLSIDKQIALELAALAIYNHNFSYYINDPDKKDYYRPVFQQNPISYLLKICDDMQEWDRRYFELSEENEFTFCPTCLSPIVRIKKYVDGEKVTNMFCACDKKTYKNSQPFPARNMYIVTTCKNLDIFKTESSDLIFKLNYSLLHLLYMSHISTSYSVYRTKELSKLKVLLLNQKFYDNDQDKNKIKNIYIDYTMSNNPVFLKAAIVLKYILEVLSLKEHKISEKDYIINKEYFGLLADCFEDIKTKIKSIDFLGRSKIKFYKNFEEEVVSLLKNKISKMLESCTEGIFYFWIGIYNGFYKLYDDLWEIFCEKFCKKYPKSDVNELKTLKWNDLSEHINDVIKENCCKCLVKIMDVDEQTPLPKDEKEDYRKNFINMLEKKMPFYLELAGFIFQSKIDASKLPNKDDFIKYMCSLEPCEKPQSVFGELMNDLLNDSYENLINQVDFNTNFDTIKYQKQYLQKKKLSHTVEKYCNSLNWYEDNSKSYTEFIFKNLDYHSDLYVFEELGNKIWMKKNKDKK